MNAPLSGLTVVDLSGTLASALTGLWLADCGAEVIQVEPPGGSPLRSEPAYPLWQRGKKSIVLDLATAPNREIARTLCGGADVVIDSWRTGVAERLGLGYDDLAAANPGLVYCSITGFGRQGPCAHLKGHEGLVMAKLGAFAAMSNQVARSGPSFAAAPFATFGAAQTAAHGILAALLDRERGGAGQRVEANLAQGLASLDPLYFYVRVLAERYPEAFLAVPAITDDGRPNSDLALKGLVALTKDGHWLQFSQVQPHMFRPFVEALGLGWMFEDPRWKTIPVFDNLEDRVACWRLMLEAAREKTLDEWLAIMAADSNIWAEQFRTAPELLHHPQLEHNRQVAEVDDPERGRVRQLGRMIQFEGDDAGCEPAPTLDQHGAELRARVAGPTQPGGASPSSGLPLEGVTIIELGIFFAGPYAATLLADLGARVIKIEPLAGDPMRFFVWMPEISGVKAVSGKESFAVDMASAEGRAVVHELISQADVVVQSYRAGVARRLGVDAETVRAVNPGLIYLNASGYGSSGPYGDKPAFGMTMGAAALALRNMGGTVDVRADLTIDEIMDQSMRLWCATSVGVVTCDGLAALASATAMLVGLLGRARGRPTPSMLTSMLCSSAYAVTDDAVEYAGRPPAQRCDDDLHGFGALYRLYRSADGWVFLAAPGSHEWGPLAAALPQLATPEFADPGLRRCNDALLTDMLQSIFLGDTSAGWEQRMTAAGVGLVVAEPRSAEEVFLSELGRDSGYVVDVPHPTFDELPRLTPLVRFSRSTTRAGRGCLIGEHTLEILRELGRTDDAIRELLDAGLIAGDGLEALAPSEAPAR
jgi:crotonobetainyl-CoA:carnitine CoA-transferase CaiB-like acyl-CoA transferase